MTARWLRAVGQVTDVVPGRATAWGDAARID
jgi:hypothetical protein